MVCSIPGCAVQANKDCFSMFNPMDKAAYREVISRWVVLLLVLLEKVAAK